MTESQASHTYRANACSASEQDASLAAIAAREFKAEMQSPPWYRYAIPYFFFAAGVLLLFFSPIHSIFLIAIGASTWYAIRYAIIKDHAKLFICEKKGWMYDPTSRPERGDALAKLWEMTDGHSRRVEDQIWAPQFYAGEFQHTIGHGKHRQTHTYSFVGIPVRLPVEFNLTPQGWQFFTGSKELQLESEQFNKTFEFSYSGSKEEMAHHITQVLTPHMQIELCDLVKSAGKLRIFFRTDSIFFLTKRAFFRPSFGSVMRMDVSQKDLEELERRLRVFVDFAKRISA